MIALPEHTQEEFTYYKECIKNDILKTCSFNNENFHDITDRDVAIIFDIYNDFFFDGTLKRDNTFEFRASNRLTRCAGNIRYTGIVGDSHYIIKMSRKILLETFRNGEGYYDCNGVTVYSRLDALLSVLEHEITHFIERETCGTTSCSRKRFLGIANTLFYHTKAKHDLKNHSEMRKVANRYDDILKRDTIKNNLPKKAKVSFNYRGNRIEGVVTRKNKKTATVHINKFHYYRVPYHILTVLS